MVAQRSPRTYWRVRRCPACGYTDRASAFPTDHYGAAWDPTAPVTRWCPECKYTGATSNFGVVRERYPVEHTA